MNQVMPPSKFTSMNAQWMEEAQLADTIDSCLEKPTSVWISKDDQESGVVESRRSIFTKLTRFPSDSQRDLPKYATSEDSSQDHISQLPPDESFGMEKPTFRTQEFSRQDTDLPLTDQEAQQAPWSPDPPRRINSDLFKRVFLGRSWSTKSKSNHQSNRKSKGHQNHHSDIIASSHDGYNPSFAELLEADTFLSAVSPPSRIRFYRWIALRDYLFAPIALIPALLTHRLRPFVLLAILSHVSNLGQSCQISYPYLMRHALTHSSYPNLDWRNIAIISRIKLTLDPPPPVTKARRLLHGWILFGACAVLVISTELTIQWNYITGINNINSVGQLVPFTVGVGGLIKVCWSAVFDKEERESRWENKCLVVEKVAPWMEAADGWKRVRGAFEARCRALDPLGSDPLKMKVEF